MSNQKKKQIRDNKHFKFASAQKNIKIFVPGFAFKHDNSFDGGKDKFVGRDLLYQKLFIWLTSKSRSGSYLITGYRGMGKSLLIKRVLNAICRTGKLWNELFFYISFLCLLLYCILKINVDCFCCVDCYKDIKIILLVIFSLCTFFLIYTRYKNYLNFWLIGIRKNIINKTRIDYRHLSKYIIKNKDKRECKYYRIPIYVNLGEDILNERDILSIIAHNVRDKYKNFVKSKQNKPLFNLIIASLYILTSCYLASYIIEDDLINQKIVSTFKEVTGNDKIFEYILPVLLLFILKIIFKSLQRNYIPYISTPYKVIERLNNLCDRINANVQDNSSIAPTIKERFFTISIGRSKLKTFPFANVREIEQELQDAINTINRIKTCPYFYKAQFIIIFDELDKISFSENRSQNNDSIDAPEFDTSLDVFSEPMGYEKRKKDVLNLLANMKYFINTVYAKCVFISGHELYDASLADLSDREFAISSIFNGVINVNSFLTPERGQSEVTSMTELYVSTMLLPEDYLIEKIIKNIADNGIVKNEIPSLRWYNEYLIENLIKTYPNENDNFYIEREEEIKSLIEFLNHFITYLAHICNGSPKKISTYFEKHIQTEFNILQANEWNDILVFGYPIEKKVEEQCVLWFTPDDQRFINFMYYIASPIMRCITNEVSHYGDKLLVTSSFIIDQIYKYHDKGFSWRNLEQMPELLNANKNPELRDSMTSMMDFLLQTHITCISAGVNQFKFHKQIAEEIKYISMISEEAAAIFNFTLNESITVKKYNTKLLEYYLNLSQKAPNKKAYNKVLERLHENLGDIYYMDEDYYCAIHEYRNSLRYIDSDISANNIINYLKCSMKIGMSYEYRRTYENAYMTYGEIINKLIHLRNIDENSFGLNCMYDWTNDWRIKQPILTDYISWNKKIGKKTASSCDFIKESTLKENIRDYIPSDTIISSFTSHITPEKSEVLQILNAFEDIRYIYLAIIAKLFVVEKMDLGGISYSNIEVAESEFIYLNNTTNVQNKYMISADFFHRLSEIMYYKNGYVTPLLKIDNIVSSLYFYDYNILGLLDEFCSIYRINSNVVDIKKHVHKFFNRITLCLSDASESIEEIIIDKIKNTKFEDVDDHLLRSRLKNDFVEYIKFFFSHQNIENKKVKVVTNNAKSCAHKRETLLKLGYKLPCNSCKYNHRSLRVFINNFFVDLNDSFDNEEYTSCLFKLLNFTSRKYIHHIRQSEMSLLASICEQMGDILLSCSLTRTKEFNEMCKKRHSFFNSFNWDNDPKLQDDITVDVIEFIEQLSGKNISEIDRKDLIYKYKNKINSKLDESLLYYWTASRFYEIASLNKEASHCMERMLKIIQGYLKVIGSSENSRQKCIESVKRLCGDVNTINNYKEQFVLINNIFRQAAMFVGKEFDNYELGEIHEYRWLLHIERMYDIDLSILSKSSDLKSIMLVAMDIKIRSWDYLNKFDTSYIKLDFKEIYQKYIINIYEKIASPLRHNKTFKEEVLSYYMKAYMNKRILIDCLGVDIMNNEKSKFIYDNKNYDFYEDFYKQLSSYLNNDAYNIGKALFNTDDVQSRLSLLEYLIQDSFVCLSYVLTVLTPHNNLTTFSNIFTAEVYDLLWEWSKYYEMLYDLYIYKKYDETYNNEFKDAITNMMVRNTSTNKETIESLIKRCIETIKPYVKDKDETGYLYTRLLMSIRHDVDDATIHHIFTNVSAEMARKYYQMAKDINNEGPAYKNMISTMYVLDDDLHNDTSQSNLADERYLLHCGIIDRNRDVMTGMYDDSSVNKLKSYEYKLENITSNYKQYLKDRLEDSIYLNSEY